MVRRHPAAAFRSAAGLGVWHSRAADAGLVLFLRCGAAARRAFDQALGPCEHCTSTDGARGWGLQPLCTASSWSSCCPADGGHLDVVAASRSHKGVPFALLHGSGSGLEELWQDSWSTATSQRSLAQQHTSQRSPPLRSQRRVWVSGGGARPGDAASPRLTICSGSTPLIKKAGEKTP